MAGMFTAAPFPSIRSVIGEGRSGAGLFFVSGMRMVSLHRTSASEPPGETAPVGTQMVSEALTSFVLTPVSLMPSTGCGLAGKGHDPPGGGDQFFHHQEDYAP